MEIHYEDEVFHFDLEDVTLAQATYIHKRLGLTLMGLDQGLMEGHPDALRAVWYLIKVQGGEKVNIDNLDFKIVKFANAVQTASEKEQKEKEAEGEDPKEPEDQTETP